MVPTIRKLDFPGTLFHQLKAVMAALANGVSRLGVYKEKESSWPVKKRKTIGPAGHNGNFRSFAVFPSLTNLF
ncbi:hypothetical protein HY994_02310 [Candidatus Micrarchaeota archaeon]|nr:hypothetical protein [Candidatus Micrarchaeota archaeon]